MADFFEVFMPDFRWDLVRPRAELALHQLLNETHHLMWPLVDPEDRARLVGAGKDFLIKGIMMVLPTSETTAEQAVIPPAGMDESAFVSYCLVLGRRREQQDTLRDERIGHAAARSGTLALAAVSLTANRDNLGEMLPLLYVPKLFVGELAPPDLPERQVSAFAVDLAQRLIYETARP